ncbi:unnamed protein product, partial [Medioppia subpectinata]
MTHEMKHLKTSLETTYGCENEDQKRHQPKIYAKNSMDRFGDDLCALLLSYLSFEDRFQCECVSKQFQRTVFESVVDITLSDRFIQRLLKEKRNRFQCECVSKQFQRTVFGSVVDITLSDRFIQRLLNAKKSDTEMLAIIAVKCAKIQTIDCRGITKDYEKRIPEVLGILRQYCRHLRDIYCDLSANSRQMMATFGPLVTRIDAINSYNDSQALTHCHRLSQLRINSFNDIFYIIYDKLFVKNVHKIVFRKHAAYEYHRWTSFVAQNQCLQSLAIKLSYIRPEELKKLSVQLSRLPQLRELTLSLNLSHGQTSAAVTDSMRTIGLCLEIYAVIDERVLEPLRHCKRLTHLDIYLKKINTNVLKDLYQYCPRLHYLFIRDLNDIIDTECLSHLSRLPALQMLVIETHNNITTSDNDLNAVLSSSLKLKTIEIRTVHMTQQMKHLKTSLETRVDGEDEDEERQPKIYAKNSMDRFGDDLCELLLSYLSFEDAKVTLTHRFVKIIDCRGITRNYENRVPEVLGILRDYCRHLRDIYCGLWPNRGQSIGPLGPLVTRLENINSFSDSKTVTQCHRLSHLWVHSGKHRVLVSEVSDRYFLCYMRSEESLMELSVQLSRLLQLRELTLGLRVIGGQTLAAVTDSLRTIGVNCKQLQRFSLQLAARAGEPAINISLDWLRSYGSLKRLCLEINVVIDERLLEPLRHCKRLTHLEIYIKKINTNVLKDLHKYFPRLQYLFIHDLNGVIDTECLDHISRLPALQTLVIQSHNNITSSDNDLNAVLSSSPKLKTIEIRIKTSVVNTDDGIEDNTQQSNIYAKNSMDRFGDDFYGLILSYLSLEDRFQCECVSKQFQRTLFVSVVDITLSDEFIQKLLNAKRSDVQMLATIAIKCANIECIDCRGISYGYEEHIPEVLNTFRDNCRHLREIYLTSKSAQTMPSLGPLVTRIGEVRSCEPVFAHNWCELQRLSLQLISVDTEPVFPISLDSLRVYRQLKRLHLTAYATVDDLLLDPLRHCKRLTDLVLCLCRMKPNVLKDIHIKCPRLQYLFFNDWNSIKCWNNTECLDYISRLPALQTLVIDFDDFDEESANLSDKDFSDNNFPDLLSRNMTQEVTQIMTSLETTDDGNEDSIQQPKIYAKNSMDRFGDDMCGLILSYISLEDRFRYECVSKQFQRTVFGSVVFIDINDRFDDKSQTCFTAMIEVLAKKCPNIETIDFRGMFIGCEEHYPEVLRLFRDNCHNLREVYCSLEENTAQMYRHFGPLVTQIDCNKLSDTVVDITSGQLLANNLKTFALNCYSAEDNELFTAFVAHNQCLKSLDIENIYSDLNVTLPELAVQLSRLTQLRRLGLSLGIMRGQTLVVNLCLRTIGENCKQLQRLSLEVCNYTPAVYVNTLDSLRYYSQLKRLDLTIYVAFDEKMLDLLRHCKRLTHLKLYLTQMTANAFINCLKNCPRLQYLYTHDFHNIMGAESLDELSRLPALQTLIIFFRQDYDLINNHFWDLMARSAKLKCIRLRVRNMTQEVTQMMTSVETTDDGNEDHIQHPKIYAKNSMDRFGDDMCGLILSYLSLEDRFRCECVSKQFQRTVFESVVDIDINDRFHDKFKTCFTAIIELLAKKCPNIETIDFRGMFIECKKHIREMLRLFRDNCLNLRQIYCSFDKKMAQLYQQFGPLVTRIDCDALSDTVVDTTSGQLLANNLKTFEFHRYSAEDSQLLSSFVANNQCLKSLDIYKIFVDLNDTLPELAVQLSRLTQLRRLRLRLEMNGQTLVVNQCLRTIGENCKQLQRLILEVYNAVNVETLDSLRYYCRLKRLHLTIYAVFDEKVLDPLRHCKRLTHLELHLRLGANVLKDLHIKCPRLQYLSIRGLNNITGAESLDELSRLPALQTVVILFPQDYDLIDNDVWDVFARSARFKSILLRRHSGVKFYYRKYAINMKHLKTSLETRDEDNIQQAKNSMDRFGDDLYGLLLSYFPLEDKFRYECVSKQFQRTVFVSAVDITLSDGFMYKFLKEKTINTQLLATIAIKCRNFQTIDCRGIGTEYEKRIPEVLGIFRDNCLNLREIYCNLRVRSQMMLTFGPLVTRIYSMDPFRKQSLIHCHRLSHLRVNSLSDVFDKTCGRLLAKNLHKFTFFCDSNNDKKLLSEFLAHNQSLKSLEVIDIRYKSADTLPVMCGQLSRLPQLRELKLSLMSDQKSLSESLRIIGLNCKQLQRLSLMFATTDSELNGQTLDSLRVYSRLKRLDLYFYDGIDGEVLEPLKLCHRLTHLTLNTWELSANFVVDCDQHWPRLQYLCLNITELTGDCLSHISRLPALQTLVIDFEECDDNSEDSEGCGEESNDLSDNKYSDLLSRSPKLKNITINGQNIPTVHGRSFKEGRFYNYHSNEGNGRVHGRSFKEGRFYNYHSNEGKFHHDNNLNVSAVDCSLEKIFIRRALSMDPYNGRWMFRDPFSESAWDNIGVMYKADQN